MDGCVEPQTLQPLLPSAGQQTNGAPQRDAGDGDRTGWTGCRPGRGHSTLAAQPKLLHQLGRVEAGMCGLPDLASTTAAMRGNRLTYRAVRDTFRRCQLAEPDHFKPRRDYYDVPRRTRTLLPATAWHLDDTTQLENDKRCAVIAALRLRSAATRLPLRPHWPLAELAAHRGRPRGRGAPCPAGWVGHCPGDSRHSTCSTAIRSPCAAQSRAIELADHCVLCREAGWSHRGRAGRLTRWHPTRPSCRLGCLP